MNPDAYFLKKTLQLAQKGLGWTNPNPLVGAVIVKNNRIISQGFHHKAGYPHAEIEALNAVSENPRGATMYVNLEPCSTFGKTPPCVDSILKSGIKKVVCSTLDPNPKNHRRGIAKLQQARIITSVGILTTQAKQLNEAFFTFHTLKRPFVALKFAASLDGKIATFTGHSKWITNEKARSYARSLRAQYQAVLVGINTVLIDNPHLGTRIKGKKDPLRIILDAKLQIPLTAQVLRDQNVLLATTTRADKNKKAYLKKMGLTILTFNSQSIAIKDLLASLKDLEIISVLVEGGGQTLGGFIDSKLIDKVYAFHAPLLIGGKEAISIRGKGASNIQKAFRLQEVSFRKFYDNLLTIGSAKNN